MSATLVVSILSLVFHLIVGVLLLVHINYDFEYDQINLLPIKSVVQQPITYLQVENGSGPIINNHNFFYWEGMYLVEEPMCESNCIFIDRVKGYNLTIWKNTTFISQSSTNHNYYTLLKQAKPQGEPCDEGYKHCGILDSFNQTLCLLENETCPLNQIELSNSSTPSDIFTNKDVVNTTLLNDNITYLHTSNAEINSLVIIDVVLGPESFCFEFGKRKLGPPYYGFERSSSGSYCTEYGEYETDYHYVSIDKHPKYNVYNENGIIPKLQGFVEYSGDPYPLEKLKNYNLHLYKRNYVGFEITCLGDKELNEESINFVKKYKGTIFGLNLAAAIISLTNSFLCIGACVVACDNAKEVQDAAEKQKELIESWIISCAVSLAIIPLISVSFGLSLTSTNSIFKCADAPIAEKFIGTKTLDIILMTLSFGLYLLMIVTNLTIVVIVNVYLCFYKKQKEKLTQEDPK